MLHGRAVAEVYDYVLVGGGLQNGLIALALRARAPDTRIALIERDGALGGNHTWCFHARDVSASARSWVEPLVVKRWSQYQVGFPGLNRVLDHAYAAITSESLDRVVSAGLAAGAGCALLTGVAAVEVDADRVTLADGRELRGFVVDARGPGRDQLPAHSGFQKFVGLELELEHEPDAPPLQPLVMDARVEQIDGYRFVYVLPFSPTRILVEDTYFSNNSRLDRAQVRARVLDYAERAGLTPARVVRQEHGVLPMPWRAAHDHDHARGPLVAGYQGGWFHPGTGYSLPVAVRLAALIAAHAPHPLPAAALAQHRRLHERQAGYARFLNWLLFNAIKPEQRWSVFERFYRLSPQTILRFYALELNARDRVRILLGRPPRGLRLPWPGKQ